MNWITFSIIHVPLVPEMCVLQCERFFS